MKRAALLLPLLMFIGFVALAVFRLQQPGDRVITSKMVGQPVPAFALTGIDARPGLGTADLAAGKVTLVNVFASWCLPCRVEAPQLKALADKGVVIHGIAVRDKPEDIAAFLGEYGDPFERIGMDSESRAMLALGAAGVPETFLVDGRGVIRRQYVGMITTGQVTNILRDIEAAKR